MKHVMPTGARVGGWWIPPVAAIALWMAPLPASMVEAVYSRRAFPIFQPWLTTLSNVTPFAWLDLWILVAVLLSGWRVLRLFRQKRAGGLLGIGWELLRRVVRAAGYLVLAFLLLWGLNYRRVPLERALTTGAPPTPPSVADLQNVLTEANVLATRLRPIAMAHPRSYEDIAAVLPESFNRALAHLGRPGLWAFGRPKYTLLTPYFTVAGINGMVDPFGLESIVHPDALPFERAFILAHEWAHLAGQADEAEASAVGWLACMYGDPTLAYSATVFLVVELASALPRAVWREMLPSLDPGLRADLQALNARWARAQPVVQHAASRVYDQYLRANRVDDGVRSYSRALSLILLPPLRQEITAYPTDQSRPR